MKKVKCERLVQCMRRGGYWEEWDFYRIYPGMIVRLFTLEGVPIADADTGKEYFRATIGAFCRIDEDHDESAYFVYSSDFYEEETGYAYTDKQH